MLDDVLQVYSQSPLQKNHHAATTVSPLGITTVSPPVTTISPPVTKINFEQTPKKNGFALCSFIKNVLLINGRGMQRGRGQLKFSALAPGGVLRAHTITTPLP